MVVCLKNTGTRSSNDLIGHLVSLEMPFEMRPESLIFKVPVSIGREEDMFRNRSNPRTCYGMDLSRVEAAMQDIHHPSDCFFLWPLAASHVGETAGGAQRLASLSLLGTPCAFPFPYLSVGVELVASHLTG